MDNSKYYFVKRKGDQAYPLVNILNLGEVEHGNTDVLNVEMRTPIPQNPVMADFLSGGKDIFTCRITDVMQKMNMKGIRFFLAEVDDTRGVIYDNYVCVFADENTYELMDKELSKFIYKYGVYRIQKLVLNRVELNKISLDKRLCLRLKEAPGYVLYHQSVVDAIMELEPTGMYFQDIEEYGFY